MHEQQFMIGYDLPQQLLMTRENEKELRHDFLLNNTETSQITIIDGQTTLKSKPMAKKIRNRYNHTTANKAVPCKAHFDQQQQDITFILVLKEARTETTQGIFHEIKRIKKK